MEGHELSAISHDATAEHAGFIRDAPISGVSRRTVTTGVAWAVPAIVMASTTPAFAVSSTLLTLSTANNGIPADGSVVVTANLKTPAGFNLPGRSVTFTLPAGATYTGSTTKTTNSSGNATITMDLNNPWAKPGSIVTVSAISGSETKSQPFPVLGANLLAAGYGFSTALTQTALVFPSPVVQVAAGFDSAGNGSGVLAWFLALLQDGTVWAMGHNGSGQLGDGSTTSRSTWARVAAVSGAIQVAAGSKTAYVLLSDGTVRAWGSNFGGALGRSGGPGASSSSPVTVPGLAGVTQISAGDSSGFALLSDGTVSGWGKNIAGALGDGTTVDRPAPTFVSGGAPGPLSGVTQIAATGWGGYALLADGTVRAWGSNTDGQVGDGTTTDRPTPVSVSGLTGVTQIAGGFNHGYALLADTTVRAWGAGDAGQMGNGSTANQSTPVAVGGLINVTEVSATRFNGYARLADGTGRTWGSGGLGRLGNGGATASSTLVTPSPMQGQSVAGMVGGVTGLSLLIETA